MKFKNSQVLGAYGATYDYTSEFIYKTVSYCFGYFIRKMNWKLTMAENVDISEEFKSLVLKNHDNNIRNPIFKAKTNQIEKIKNTQDKKAIALKYLQFDENRGQKVKFVQSLFDHTPITRQSPIKAYNSVFAKKMHDVSKGVHCIQSYVDTAYLKYHNLLRQSESLKAKSFERETLLIKKKIQLDLINQEIKSIEKHEKNLELYNKELKNKIEQKNRVKPIINLDF